MVCFSYSAVSFVLYGLARYNPRNPDAIPFYLVNIRNIIRTIFA